MGEAQGITVESSQSPQSQSGSTNCRSSSRESNGRAPVALDPHESTPSAPRRYLSLFGASMALFSSVGLMNAFGVFQAYYSLVALRGYSEFAISWIGSVATFVLFAGCLPAGMLADRFGPMPPMVLGSLVTLLGIFLLSLCRDGQYYQFFLTQGVLMPAGMGLLTIPPMSVVAMTFKDKRRGLGLGVTIAGSSIGGLIWPVVLNQLINVDGVSFAWAIRVCGFLMLAILTVACVTVPLSVPSMAEKRKNMAREGQAGASAATAESIESGSEEKKRPKSKKEIIKSTPVILTCLGLAVVYLAIFVPFFYVSTYSLARGMTTVLSFYLVSILNAVSLFGRISAGIAADRLGSFNLLALATLLSALIIFTWTAATGVAGIVVWAACYGFTSGAIMSLSSACAAQLATPETVGSVIGVMMSASAVTGLFGTPIAGQLVTRGYLALSMYAGAAMLAGGLLIVAARMVQSRKLLAKV